MNDKQIEAFLETGKHQSFTKAAQNPDLPQPAISRYISALEQELGVTLFIRENSRHITLSDEGKLYFNFFQRYYAEFINIRKMLSHNMTSLRLGYNVGWDMSSFLPDVIDSYRKDHPNFEISLECISFRDLLQGLDDKHLDAIICTDDYMEGRSDLLRQNFTSIKRIITYSEKLPGFENIKTPADFKDYTFYMMDDPKVAELCQDIALMFKPYSFIPRFLAVPNISTVFASVENGLGVAVLDSWYEGVHHPNIHTMDLGGELKISMAWPRSTISPVVEDLYQKIYDHFNSKDK